MSVVRRCAAGVALVAAALLPARLGHWGDVMRSEVAAVESDGAALHFALGCLAGALIEAVSHLVGGTGEMNGSTRRTASCALAATALGLLYMAIAGAPLGYLAFNVGALAIGFLGVAIVGQAPRLPIGAVSLVLGGLLLATTLLGVTVDGATRWVSLGGLSIQPSLIVLPVLALAFAGAGDRLALLGILAASAALALQPDRAMAGALAAAMLALVLVRPAANHLIALAASSAGFAATMVQIDVQGAMPFVDRIFYSAFHVHPLAGLAVLAGAVILLVPAALGMLRDPEHRAVHATFGGMWLAILVAAALGNYPTPLVGYGGSAIIGYVLCLAALPRARESRAGRRTGRQQRDHALRSALA
jgi:hypothetical protein